MFHDENGVKRADRMQDHLPFRTPERVVKKSSQIFSEPEKPVPHTTNFCAAERRINRCFNHFSDANKFASILNT